MTTGAFDVQRYAFETALEIHRRQFAEHMRQFPQDDPEYGGTIVDWAWDWYKTHPVPTMPAEPLRHTRPACDHLPLIAGCPDCFWWLLELVQRAQFILTHRETHTNALGNAEYYMREPNWLIDAERGLRGRMQ